VQLLLRMITDLINLRRRKMHLGGWTDRRQQWLRAL